MRTPTDCAVIAFPQDRVRPVTEVPAAPAEVLIFTGVRIERMYDLSERLTVGRVRPSSSSAGPQARST